MPATLSTNVRSDRAVVRLRKPPSPSCAQLKFKFSETTIGRAATAFISVSNSTSVRCSSRLLLLSILYFLSAAVSRDSRACAVKRRHVISTLTFTCRLSMPGIRRCGATKSPSSCCVALPPLRSKDLQWRFTPSDYLIRTRPQQRLEAATPAIRWCNKNKNTRENDRGNAPETITHRIQRDGQAHPQIALGGIGRESGTARERAGTARGHRHGSLDTK